MPMQNQTCFISSDTIVRLSISYLYPRLRGAFQLSLQDGIFAYPPEMAVVASALCSYAVGIKPNWTQELQEPLVAA